MVSGAYSPMWIQQLLKMPGLGDVMAFLTNELTFRLNFEKLFAQDQPTHVYRDAYESVTRRNGKRCYSRLIRYMNEREEWNNWWLTALAHSDIPVELVWGMQDPVSGPAVAHGVVKRVLRATFTPLGTVGHYPQIVAPGRVAERILEFFGTPHTEDD